MPKKITLNEQTELLATHLISEKTFFFDKSDYPDKYTNLINAGILEDKDGQLIIRDDVPLVQPVFSLLSKINSTNITNLVAVKEELTILDRFFTLEHFSHEGSRFQDKLLSQALTTYVNDYGLKLLELFKILTPEDNAFYSIIEAFAQTISVLNISVGEIINVVELQYKLQEKKDDGMPDLSMDAVGKAIRDFCNANTEKGQLFFNECIKVSPRRLVKQHPNILAGLLSSNQKFFGELKLLFQFPDMRLSVLTTFSILEPASKSMASNYYDLIAGHSACQVEETIQLHFFYRKLLEYATKIGDKKLEQLILSQLKTLLKSTDANVLQNFFWQFNYMKGYDEVIVQLLSDFVDQDNFDAVYLKMMIKMCYLHASYALFFGLLRKMIAKLGTAFPISEVNSDIFSLRHNNAVDFDSNLVSLLIDNKGLNRLMGSRILSRMSSRGSGQGFQCDILSFNALIQYKLIVAISEEQDEPKDVLPFLSPLLSSRYELVVELLIHKLEIFAENYGEDVIKALNANINHTDNKQVDILGRVTDYLASVIELRGQKTHVKELNPFYTQNTSLQQYFKSRDRNMREQMDKTPKEGFLSMINTVQLIKGGGWKLPDKDEVSQLGTIETTMRLSREYILAPERYEFGRASNFSEDWTNKFEPWEAEISL